MRVLLDENLDRRLKQHFPPEAEALTVQERGWGSKENGELLGLAQAEFDVFVTMDRGIPHQQDLARFDIAIVLLEARSNKLVDLLPLMNAVTDSLRSVQPGDLSRITG